MNNLIKVVLSLVPLSLLALGVLGVIHLSNDNALFFKDLSPDLQTPLAWTSVVVAGLMLLTGVGMKGMGLYKKRKSHKSRGRRR